MMVFEKEDISFLNFLQKKKKKCAKRRIDSQTEFLQELRIPQDRKKFQKNNRISLPQNNFMVSFSEFQPGSLINQHQH